MMRVALDVMGGDLGPDEIIRGAIASVDRGLVSPSDVILVGRKADILASLTQDGRAPDLFPVVGMDESPVEALRRKPDNSLSRCMRLVKEGEAQAVVSAGSTGAAVAAAMMSLRPLEGIRRPGIAVVIEGAAGPFCVIDVGANPQPKPVHLLHYGIMGSALLKDAYGIESPRVGLMNIGSEDKKGNEFAREVHALFKRSRANFVGNVAGNNTFRGTCDVIVTDGFVGNVLLKVAERLAAFLFCVLQSELAGSDLRSSAGELLSRIHRRIDYSEYGGALLLGIEGICIICHGRSDAKAISNAIAVAVKAVTSKVTQHIVSDVRDLGSLEPA